MIRFSGLLTLAVSVIGLCISCTGPTLSKEDAIKSVKEQIILDDLLDRNIIRERQQLENSINYYFQKYSDYGEIYTVTSGYVTASDCIGIIHDIVSNKRRGLNIAIELYDNDPLIFNYSFSSFISVVNQLDDGQELHAGSYDGTYIYDILNYISDSFCQDDFLDDLSCYFYGRVWSTCQAAADRIDILSIERKSGEWLVKTDKYGLFSVKKISDEIIVVPESLY